MIIFNLLLVVLSATVLIGTAAFNMPLLGAIALLLQVPVLINFINSIVED